MASSLERVDPRKARVPNERVLAMRTADLAFALILLPFVPHPGLA